MRFTELDVEIFVSVRVLAMSSIRKLFIFPYGVAIDPDKEFKSFTGKQKTIILRYN